MKNFLLGLLALSLLTLSSEGATFTYTRTITVNHTQVPNTDQASFPVYLVLSDPGLKSVANGGHVQSPTGADITFFSDSALTMALPYEVVAYSATAGTLTAIVQCPVVSHTSDTVFYMGYDAPSITVSAANPAIVWSGYQGVYHLEDNAANNSIVNSAPSNSNGQAQNPTAGMTATGKIGLGLSFNGSTDYLDLGNYAGINNSTTLTYSGWVKFASLAQYVSLFDKFDDPGGAGSGIGLAGGYQSANGSSDWLTAVRYQNISANYTSNFGIQTGQWYYFASVYNANTITLYINGAAVQLSSSGSIAPTVPSTSSDLYVGIEKSLGISFTGVLDELRVSTIAFSADWIASEYHNLNNPASFATLGTETVVASSNIQVTQMPVQVLGTTPTQALLRYAAPDSNACSVQVSDNAATNIYTGSFLTVVHDVDATLFAGANQDNRSGNLVNGTARTIVVGYRGVGDASDGKTYSRALQANTTHYFQISCGGGTSFGSGSFTTANVPLGNAGPDPIAYDSKTWGGWAWPTLDYTNINANYVDPQTGVLLKRWTSPGDEGSLDPNIPFAGITDFASVWQNVRSIGSAADGNYATYTGAGGPSNALFLWGKLSFYRPSFSPVTFATVDDVRIHINGFGDQANPPDRTVSVCLSADYGQTCLGSSIDVVLPQNMAADTVGPNPWPAPLFAGWGNAPVTADMMMNNFSGTLTSITGNAVVWGANQSNGFNNYFPVTVLKVGSRIMVSGTDPVCPGNQCTISGLTDEQHLTIQQNVGTWNPLFTTLTNAIHAGDTTFTVAAANGFVASLWGPYPLMVESESISCNTLQGNTFSNCSAFVNAHASGAPAGENQYLLPNFGFKLWKKTGTGKISIDSALNDWADSSNMFTDYQGAGSPYCTSGTVTANYAADGITPIAPLPGYICTFNSMWGTERLYFVAPSTGEARKLSNLYNLSPTLNDQNPTQFFVFNNYYETIQGCTYNAADPVNGRFKAWSDGRNQALDNPAITCSNISAPGFDVATEIRLAHPEIDQTYFGAPVFQNASYPYFEFMLRPLQGAIAWFCIIDITQQPGASQVVKCRNDWDTYPIRWSASHGNEYFDGDGYTLMGSQTGLLNPGQARAERWDLDLTQVYNNGGSTAIPASFVDPQTCEQLGVTDARWIAQGATGYNCVRINVIREPVAKTPAADDMTPLGSFPVGSRPAPWPHNAGSCGGDGTTSNCWSYLQPTAEGDYIQDAAYSFGDEKFLIAKKTVLTNGSIDLVLARNMNPFGCRSSNTPQSHAANWVAYMWPPMSCGVATYFSKITDPPSMTQVDNPQTYLGHTVAWLNRWGNELHFAPYSWNYPPEMGGYGSGYGVRSGPFPGVLGQYFIFGVNDVYPFAGDNHGLSIGQVQSHPGGITDNAPPRESNWGVDGRPLGGSSGGQQFLWNNNISPVSGAKNVFQLSVPLSSPNGVPITLSNWDTSLSRKKRQVLAFAGYHLLRDISGPGSQITDSTTWTFCVADFAGECVAGSAQGNQYVSVPTASTTGNCTNDGTIFGPCLATAGPADGAYTQFGVDRPDPFGLRWRKLTNMFGGPGRADNYANMHALATGDWGVSSVKWGDGRRSDVFGIKLPPWPNEDSVARNTFVNVAVSLGGQPGSLVRIRFGYDANLFCSTRQEQCTTAVANSDPYAWASETQQWTPCDNGCTIGIPAIASRVLYYVVDRKGSSGSTTSSPAMMTVVN